MSCSSSGAGGGAGAAPLRFVVGGGWCLVFGALQHAGGPQAGLTVSADVYDMALLGLKRVLMTCN